MNELTDNDWTGDVDVESRGTMLADISNAMVGLKKRHFGKGPSKARSYINDQYVFCVLEGGLTANEQTLVEAGHEREVRSYRLLFQETMSETTTAAIEEITGRRVIGYQSQIVFDPPRGFEIFVLDRPPERAA